MTNKIKLVQGDTRPQIKCVIRDETTGVPQNIAGATVILKFREYKIPDVITTWEGHLLPGLDQEDGSISLEPPYDQLGAGGRVVFVPNLEATMSFPGQYEGEIEITFADGSVQTVYQPLRFVLREQF